MRLDEVEHFEHGKTLRRRRRVEDRDVAVAANKGLAPDRLLPAEIGKPEQAGVFLGEARHLGGHRPLVKALPSLICDRLQRARQVGVGEPFARRRGRALREKQRGGFAIPQEIIAHHLDEACKAAGDRKAVARVAE